MPFKVSLRSRRVQRELDAVEQTDYERLLRALRLLEQEPRPVGNKRLYDSVYRIRVGPWRVVYKVDDEKQLVEVGGILRRNEGTYRDIDSLFS